MLEQKVGNLFLSWSGYVHYCGCAVLCKYRFVEAYTCAWGGALSGTHTNRYFWFFALRCKVSSFTTTHSAMLFSPPAVPAKNEAVGFLVDVVSTGAVSRSKATAAIDVVACLVELSFYCAVGRSTTATHWFASVAAPSDEGSRNALAQPIRSASQLSHCFGWKYLALPQRLQSLWPLIWRTRYVYAENASQISYSARYKSRSTLFSYRRRERRW